MKFNLIEWLYLKQKGNLVYYDSLTNIHSRTYYDRILKKKYINKDYIVVFIDIDNLKKYNDKNGHNAGSKLIKRVAEQIKEINPLDCARYGGDEFVLLIEPTEQDKIERLKQIEGISIGYYEKEVYEDMSSAIKKADEIMYEDKGKKGNK
jgi:diguanylate cyclase (GGDEF)-like protein